MRRRLFAAVLLSLCVGSMGFIAWTPPGCAFVGGKWSTVAGRCVTPLCAYGWSSCGTWANPVARCERVSAGLSLRRLRFELGEPDVLTPTSAEYVASKASAARIVVRLRGDLVESIDCPTARH